MPLKLSGIGNSVGAIFPKEMLARMKVGKGDVVYVTEAPDGSYRLSPYDPEFEEQMKHAEAIMNDDRDILRVLAR
ncbi:MAG: AbrB/MazE/SpoVT family DNA-binding domain-containing protein [Pacificimonas sp.]|nr:AbrB/MazE/SpoVT family DNA-binding domain-containing protein [Pacificimonas sp.]